MKGPPLISAPAERARSRGSYCDKFGVRVGSPRTGDAGDRITISWIDSKIMQRGSVHVPQPEIARIPLVLGTVAPAVRASAAVRLRV